MTRLDAATHLGALRSDAARLAAVAAGALDRPVPACPGWVVRDVVRHLGAVYRHKAESVRLGRRAPEDVGSDWPDDDAALLPWLEAALADVRGEIDGDPGRPAWSWWPGDATTGFWQRRMAQETLVHRVDVEQAAGLPSDVDTVLAADGVDEVLTAFLPVWLAVDGAAAGVGEDLAVHVAVSTAGRTWDVRVAGVRAEVSEGASDAPARLAGPADAVLLWAWGRGGADRLGFTGDEAQLHALRRALSAATR
ncbi:maleylpyruvate isomerase family mycothiol-dependent enzyme [Kineococcus glutinatus]|uniref:Maleylpyruvate isomerase family mycothiol-dependent enzyme n=1 Tax=Kineococcus glutinatus TaxID=1070872 RepID=A0ABP9I0A9_9ACTN